MPDHRPVVLEVEGLSKAYVIRHEKAGAFQYEALRDVLARAGREAFGRLKSWFSGGGTELEEACDEEVWALKDVSFALRKGECLGVIGRNGAGKSTLLKLLSRITAPTEGRIRMRGAVASLLEVGTGFHPELTGRENIFLNGAVMGMRRREILRKFDEIVAFAEVEKYLDTPVKRYSSGMYVRLAFAVAAHLEAEILLVDEVLAVGDALFQRKSLGKMEETTRSGRTVIFVSHNMSMIASLCDRCLLLDGGRLVADGSTRVGIEAYFQGNAGVATSRSWDDLSDAPGDEAVRLRAIRLVDGRGEPVSEVPIDEAFVIEIEYEIFEQVPCVIPNLHFTDSRGVFAFMSFMSIGDTPAELATGHGPGRFLARCQVPGNLLNDQIYYISLAMIDTVRGLMRFHLRDILFVRIVDPLEEIPTRGAYRGSIAGSVRPLLAWERTRIG